MILLHMSISSSILILAIIIIRAILLNKLPKRTFIVLWGIVLCKLLIPFSISSKFSVFTFINNIFKPINKENFNIISYDVINNSQVVVTNNLAITANNTPSLPSPVWIVWLVGTIILGIYFVTTHLRYTQDYKMSLPLKNSFIDQWQKEHTLKRTIKINYSDKINTPLTYGIFNPTILLPKSMNSRNIDELKYILEHEYIHIKRFDVLYKWILTIAICMHWLNPIVWIMFIIVNRDIEIACDEAVIEKFGNNIKSRYALSLIKFLETKSNLNQLCSSFSKNSIEERIITIMNIRKKSLLSLVLGTLIVLGTTLVFATSAKVKTDNTLPVDEKATIENRVIDAKKANVIEVNISNLPEKNMINLGEVVLSEGDIITYDLISKGNGNMNVGLIHSKDYVDSSASIEDNQVEFLGHSGYVGNIIQGDTQFIVTKDLAGSYNLILGNYDGGTLSNIEGNIGITYSKQKTD